LFWYLKIQSHAARHAATDAAGAMWDIAAKGLGNADMVLPGGIFALRRPRPYSRALAGHIAASHHSRPWGAHCAYRQPPICPTRSEGDYQWEWRRGG